jgi:hypothetical protein
MAWFGGIILPHLFASVLGRIVPGTDAELPPRRLLG